MRIFYLIVFMFFLQHSYAQDKKKITYYQWLDMPQDTYVRIIRTADSLLIEYQEEPFELVQEDGSCCLHGLMFIKELYVRALFDEPEDEDAKNKISEIDNLLLDEKILNEGKDHMVIYKRGNFYFEQGYFKKALKFYNKAYELKPDSKDTKKKIKLTEKRIKKYQSS